MYVVIHVSVGFIWIASKGGNLGGLRRVSGWALVEKNGVWRACVMFSARHCLWNCMQLSSTMENVKVVAPPKRVWKYYNVKTAGAVELYRYECIATVSQYGTHVCILQLPL